MNKQTIASELGRLRPGMVFQFGWEGDKGPAIYAGGRAALLPLDDAKDIEFAQWFSQEISKQFTPPDVR